MDDTVSFLRARWTPSTTAIALAFLGQRGGAEGLSTVQTGERSLIDLRGLRVEGTQFDHVVLRDVNLRWANLRDVGFKGTRFEECNLSQAEFAQCYFRHASFERCDLVNARFEACDFSGARIAGSRLDFASFRDCEIGLDNIEFRSDASKNAMVRVCRSLKLNAMSMGNFADAGKLTYLEKTHERETLFASGRWLPWAGSCLQNLFWGYGEKPWRLALVMLFNVFLFGTTLFVVNGLPEGKEYADYLYFSGITYLTVGYGDLAPATPLARFISILNGGTGIATFGMLIASITKKVMYR